MLRVGQGPTKTKSQTFLDISMIFVKMDYCCQLEKPTSFFCLLLDVDFEKIVELVEVIVGSIALAELVGVDCRWLGFIT